MKASTLALVLLSAVPLAAQFPGARAAGAPAIEWRRVGPTILELGLASPAGGVVDRVWFSGDGSKLYARLRSRQVFVTEDFENWKSVNDIEAPGLTNASPRRFPESGSVVAEVPLQRSRMYAAGYHAYRSDDAGATWTNLTAIRAQSILGERLLDVAVSPVNPDGVVVAGANGVWRSLDAGVSWSGLNEKLPNLPVKRLIPSEADSGFRIAIAPDREMRWQAGQKTGWIPAAPDTLTREMNMLRAASASLAAEVTAIARAGDTVYAGAADGRLFVSTGNGQTWRLSPQITSAGRIERIAVDPGYGPYAVAITSSTQRGRILRTVNGGLFWDDITANLPAGSVSGVAVDRATGAVYIASEDGVFMTYTDTLAAGMPTSWMLLREGSAIDVMLDAGGNRLFVASEGAGVFAATAPHRARDPRVVSAADRRLRAVAPGALLSVIGATVQTARAGDRPASVLASGDTSSEVQLPFELSGDGVLLSFESSSGRFQVGFPVLDAAPGIFVDREGTPLVMNAETGLVLDPSSPARSGMRLQILATGLGRVTPGWPTGLAAPLEDPPRVAAPVRVYLDREPLEVLRATLAPGYVGLYVVEVQLPSIVNRGVSELSVQAGATTSNRVRLFLEP